MVSRGTMLDLSFFTGAAVEALIDGLARAEAAAQVKEAPWEKLLPGASQSLAHVLGQEMLTIAHTAEEWRAHSSLQWEIKL